MVIQSAYALASTKQKLHILWCKLLHSNIIIVNSPIDHVSLFLLQHDHTRFYGVFYAKSGNDTRSFLTDSMTTICRLPFGCGIPPPVRESQLRILKGRDNGKGHAYGSIMKTLEASVRLRATPPAFSDTRKTSTSVLFIKYSMDFCR